MNIRSRMKIFCMLQRKDLSSEKPRDLPYVNRDLEKISLFPERDEKRTKDV